MTDLSSKRGERCFTCGCEWLQIPATQRVWTVISMANGIVISTDGTTDKRDPIAELRADTRVLVLTFHHIKRYLNRQRVGIESKGERYRLWHYDIDYRLREYPLIAGLANAFDFAYQVYMVGWAEIIQQLADRETARMKQDPKARVNEAMESVR